MIRLHIFLLDFLIPFLCDPDLQCRNLLLNYLLALGRAYNEFSFLRFFSRQQIKIHYYCEIEMREINYRFRKKTQLDSIRRQSKKKIGHLSIFQKLRRRWHPLVRLALSIAYHRGQCWPLKWPLGGPFALPPPPLCRPPRSWKRLDWPPPLPGLW